MKSACDIDKDLGNSCSLLPQPTKLHISKPAERKVVSMLICIVFRGRGSSVDREQHSCSGDCGFNPRPHSTGWIGVGIM